MVDRSPFGTSLGMTSAIGAGEDIGAGAIGCLGLGLGVDGGLGWGS